MIIFLSSFTSFPSVRLLLPSPLVYSETVTSTDRITFEGFLEKEVSSPSHIANYLGTEGAEGIYVIRTSALVGGPSVLYPGEFSISQPDPGGEISIVEDPWAVGVGSISLDYRIMLGSTELSTSFPYDTTSRSPGDIVEIFLDATDDNGTRTVKLTEFVIQENPIGPVLSSFNVDYPTNTVSFNSDIAATVTWRRYLPGHVFVNKADEILAGTGAIDGGTFSISAGPNTESVAFSGGVSGPQELWIVARVGSGPISEPIGGPVDVTVSSGSPLTAPTIVGTSIGGDGSSLGVSSVEIPLPAYSSGDLVILPIGYDCRADFLVGLTATGPNGEVATVKQAAVDNEEGGNSAASIALLYYRATSDNVSGSVTISITPGGFKDAEQIICTPIVRRNVKASGDPFAQVLRTFSTTATLTASTSAITAVSAASRIEACFISDATLPPGAAPEGWFMREFGLIGPQAIQTMSRNDQTTNAGQVISAVSVSLGATAQRWVALTWELLPLGS